MEEQLDVNIDGDLATTGEDQKEVKLLATMIMDFVDGLTFLTRPAAKAVAKRLLEKLNQAGLPETSVGVIVEGVWQRLNGAGGFAESEAGNSAEQKIVEDIMRRVDGAMSIFISGLRKRIVTASPETRGGIIRAAAREAWPQVKRKLGI